MIRLQRRCHFCQTDSYHGFIIKPDSLQYYYANVLPLKNHIYLTLDFKIQLAQNSTQTSTASSVKENCGDRPRCSFWECFRLPLDPKRQLKGCRTSMPPRTCHTDVRTSGCLFVLKNSGVGYPQSI